MSSPELAVHCAALFDEALPTQTEGEWAPDLKSYTRVVVALSGGKDSVACLLHLLDLGVPRSKLIAHYHPVDGDGETLMDWPVTESYCQAIAKAYGIQFSTSYIVGGMLGEMLRNESPTAPVSIPMGEGRAVLGGQGPKGTRLKFPQVSADLAVRFCSAYAKLGPFDRWVNNDPMFRDGKTLVVTGERAEESPNRARYKVFEPHRADNRHGRRVIRHVDHWRPVHGWPEARIWQRIAKERLVPHVSYFCGAGRASCIGCVFATPDMWATTRQIAPQAFDRIATLERQFGITIHRKESVTQRADRGTPFPVDPQWVRLANSTTWDIPLFTDQWVLPPGAFRRGGGPS